MTLIDFGIAGIADAGLGPAPRTGGGEQLDPVAAQALRRKEPVPELDVAAEVYSLSALSYRILTGAPYLDLDLERDDALDAIARRLPRSFAAVGRTPWPAVEEVLARGLAKDPALRQATVAGLRDELARAASPCPADAARCRHHGRTQPRPSCEARTSTVRHGPNQMRPRRSSEPMPCRRLPSTRAAWMPTTWPSSGARGQASRAQANLSTTEDWTSSWGTPRHPVGPDDPMATHLTPSPDSPPAPLDVQCACWRTWLSTSSRARPAVVRHCTSDGARGCRPERHRSLTSGVTAPRCRAEASSLNWLMCGNHSRGASAHRRLRTRGRQAMQMMRIQGARDGRSAHRALTRHALRQSLETRTSWENRVSLAKGAP